MSTHYFPIEGLRTGPCVKCGTPCASGCEDIECVERRPDWPGYVPRETGENKS